MKRLLLLAAIVFLNACSQAPVSHEPAEVFAADKELGTDSKDLKKLDEPEELSSSQLLLDQKSQQGIDSLCNEIGHKLGSVSVFDCQHFPLIGSGHFSVLKRPITYVEFVPSEYASVERKVLVIGGIHGDEFSSISMMFKWMSLLEQDAASEEYSGNLHWRFMPLANPDGLLRKKSQRPNDRGVDLNRNFPSADWNNLAQKYWRERTYKNSRRFPGDRPASEPETIAIIDQIERFKPDVIISVRAPYHLLDYDGPSQAPEKIGELYLHQLGVYPGSLGNYAGLDLKLPVVTLELASAGIMPPKKEIEAMWRDLNRWLKDHTPEY